MSLAEMKCLAIIELGHEPKSSLVLCRAFSP